MAALPTPPTVYSFGHEAMAATFEIIVAANTPAEETGVYARQASQAVFKEIDRIERDISSFIDSSDISRINHQGASEPVRVSIYTYECLELAAQMYRQTDGVFDVTIGALMACWRTRDGKNKSPSANEITAARAHVGMDKVTFNKKDLTVALKKHGVSIDLGGIGKGYALDKAAELLQDWLKEAPEITGVLLHGGDSTVLAIGSPPGQGGWSVSIGGDLTESGVTPHEVVLSGRSLSGSGTNLRGRHIIDPRTGRPARSAPRSWASTPSATFSDALSTAFMVMSPEEVHAYCQQHPETWAVLLMRTAQGHQLKRFGTH